jgi:hypothetical protein
MMMQARETALLTPGSMSSNTPLPRLTISRSTTRWRAQGFSIHTPQAMMGEARATIREIPPAGPAKIAAPLTMTGRPGARSPASRDRLKSSLSMAWIVKRTTMAVIPSECLRVIMFCMFFCLSNSSISLNSCKSLCSHTHSIVKSQVRTEAKFHLSIETVSSVCERLQYVRFHGRRERVSPLSLHAVFPVRLLSIDTSR